MKDKPSKPLSLTKDEWRRLGYKRRLVVDGIVSVKSEIIKGDNIPSPLLIF